MAHANWKPSDIKGAASRGRKAAQPGGVLVERPAAAETDSLEPPQRRGRGRRADLDLEVDRHVGKRLRLRRTLLGMSQERLAAAIGLTFQQVQKYEKGTNRVGASMLVRLSQALDVPISFFFDDMPEGTVAAPLPTSDGLPLSRRILDLARHYSEIESETVRDQIFALVKSLSPDRDKGSE